MWIKSTPKACLYQAGGGAHDPEADPPKGKGEGKGKSKNKTVAKAQVQNGGGAQPSTDQPSSGTASSGGTGGLDQADVKATREVAELLKSMKRLHVSGEVNETSSHESIKQAIESIRRVSVREMGLLDGGATACTRTAKPHECDMNYPTVKVSLAAGEGQLMISPEGTLLSVERASPTVSYTAHRKLGYRIFCDEDVFEVVHKETGPLLIDTSTGCPEVPRAVAEDLIDQYEALVRQRKVICAKVAALAQDRDKCETEAALRLFTRRLCPEASGQLCDSVLGCLPTHTKSACWNRHKRRRARRGALVHVFAGESKDSFAKCAHALGLEHISIDIREDLCSSDIYGFLLSLALGAALRVLIGGPPCRTYTLHRHIPAGPDAPRPCGLAAAQVDMVLKG